MAYTIGINKNMGQMFEDLETLMLQEGWEKLSRNTIGSFTTSRGYKYNVGGSVYSFPGKYPDTTAIHMSPESTITHSSLPQAATQTFYNDYPTEFSISFWVNLQQCRTLNPYGIGDLPFIAPFITPGPPARRGPSLMFDKDWALGEVNYGVHGLMYIMNKYFNNKEGKGWELFVLTYSNLTKEVSCYVNNSLVYRVPFPSVLSTSTFYGAIFGLYGRGQSKTIDEFIIWNKVLSAEEVTTLYLKESKVLPTDPYVFEKYTYDVTVLKGGTYRSGTTSGAPILASILLNTSNNIDLKTPTFYSSGKDFSDNYSQVSSVGQEGTFRGLLGVSGASTVLKKYWLVVSKDRVIITYKLHDSAAVRTTPLYQTGYLGKIKSLGNDGANIFCAGTSTTSTATWTTINTSSLGSGVMYSPNNSYRLGYSGYLNVSVGHISTSLSSLFSISNSAFLSAINITYASSFLGTVDGIYVVSNTQASAEDLITINSVDYLIVPNGDLGIGSYYLAIKLN